MSTTKSAPDRSTIGAISSTGLQAPVDVSAWTIATSFGRRANASAFSTSSGSTARPHGISKGTTRARQRSTMSVMRRPNSPLTITTASSPSSRRFTRQVSMPALPVPETAKASSFAVWNTRAEQPLHFVHEREERGIEVADQRLRERSQDARVRVARSRAEQQAVRRLERRGHRLSAAQAQPKGGRVPRPRISYLCVKQRDPALVVQAPTLPAYLC